MSGEAEVKSLERKTKAFCMKLVMLATPKATSSPRIVSLREMKPEYEKLLKDCTQLRTRWVPLAPTIDKIQTELRQLSSIFDSLDDLSELKSLLSQHKFFRCALTIEKLRQTPTIEYKQVFMEFGIQDEVCRQSRMLDDQMNSIWDRGIQCYTELKQTHRVTVIRVVKTHVNILGEIYFTMLKFAGPHEDVDNRAARFMMFLQTDIIQYIAYEKSEMKAKNRQEEMTLKFYSHFRDCLETDGEKILERYATLSDFLRLFIVDSSLDGSAVRAVDLLSDFDEFASHSAPGSPSTFPNSFAAILLPPQSADEASARSEQIDLQQIFLAKAIDNYLTEAKTIVESRFHNPPTCCRLRMMDLYKLVVESSVVVDDYECESTPWPTVRISKSALDYVALLRKMYETLIRQTRPDSIKKFVAAIQQVVTLYAKAIPNKHRKEFEDLPYLAALYYNSAWYITRKLSTVLSEGIIRGSPSYATLPLFEVTTRLAQEGNLALTCSTSRQCMIVKNFARFNLESGQLGQEVIKAFVLCMDHLKFLKAVTMDIFPVAMYKMLIGNCVDGFLSELFSEDHFRLSPEFSFLMMGPQREADTEAIHKVLADFENFVPTLFENPEEVDENVRFWKQFQEFITVTKLTNEMNAVSLG